MITAFFLIMHEYILYSQCSNTQKCGLCRIVASAAESPAGKPDTGTATSPLLPSTLGHLRAGADQGSEKTILFLRNISH